MVPLYSHEFSQNLHGLGDVVDNIRQRILKEGNTKTASVSEKLQILDELTKFDLGRFMILNQGGIDGIWNHYLAYEFPRLIEDMKPKPSIERMLTEILGDCELRVRLEFAKKLLQAELRDGVSLLSVPCGVMAELSTLDFSRLSNFRLYGVDLDPHSLHKAREFNSKLGLGAHTEFACKDAWDLNLNHQFDVVVSMGLNMYVPGLDKVLDLYRSFRAALKPGGKLIVSYMTPYSSQDPETEKDFSSLNPAGVRLLGLVRDILKTRVASLYPTKDIVSQLRFAGFSKVDIYYTPCKSPNFAIATNPAR